MKDSTESANEWNIKANIGQIAFNISIDSNFFNYTTQQYSERHKHATFEFHFITKGSGTIFTDNMQYKAVPDSYYIVNAGVYHMQKGVASDPIHRYSCKFEFDIENNMNNSCSEEEIKNFVYVLSTIQFFYSRNLNRIRHIISEIQSELMSGAMGYYSKVQHLFSLLFISIIREIATDYKHNLKISPRTYQKDRLNIIDNFFDLNYSHKVTLEDLCKLVHISKSQLNRIIKEKYKMTFKQKHMEAQVEHIKDMLVNSDMSIGTISEKTGYTSESNFTAFFKHSTGVSPKVYRKQDRESSL
ncbi:MAG: hypothetical protein A2Y21_09775 [Clostridiales bacterium GWC2_40_7]|nr:MAG: hypothetical protein A2Y21_09775 [Clostridiales bacterium GWC2_40_7]